MLLQSLRTAEPEEFLAMHLKLYSINHLAFLQYLGRL